MRFITLLLFCVRCLSATNNQAIMHAPLDTRTVFRLPIAVDRVTTVYFPGPISGIEAAFVTTEGEPPARFQCSFLPGQPYFSLRAIQTNVAANINVVWNRNIFVFEVFQSPEPTYAVILSPPSRLNSPAVAKATAPVVVPQLTNSAIPSAVQLTNQPITNATTSRVLPKSYPTGRRTTEVTVVPAPRYFPRLQPPVSATGSPTNSPSLPSVPPSSRERGDARYLQVSEQPQKSEKWWSRWRIPCLIEISIGH